ncbi:MAG TPA: universal stress protein [Vicinamibacterales bacterium]|jgi:nucleotide-binding universal stress UspA family protein|nr:universal stress protein [Vicinamibacterales bacterium]
MTVFHRILVATDFSDCSAAALQYGRALARQCSATLHLLHVVQMPIAATAGIEGYVALAPDLQQEAEASARHDLEALVGAEEAVLHVSTPIAGFETPVQAIIDYAMREQIDLLIVGTHGRRGLAHVILGSVAEAVVRRAPCPVLTVRQAPPDAAAIAAPAAEARPTTAPRAKNA